MGRDLAYFDERRGATSARLAALQSSIKDDLAVDFERIIGEHTSLYVVGSGGRGELSDHSDIDIFVVRNNEAISQVDAFQIRQAIARSFHRANLPAPSQSGAFLKMHTARSLCSELGTARDDADNTLTARMLLLLESQALLGKTAYERLLVTVVQAYWKNVNEHTEDYQPFVLVNDIVRYWRILLLNYEAKNSSRRQSMSDDEWRAYNGERKLRGYKLRFSRCITCFSALAWLLDKTAHAPSIEIDHVVAMTKLQPIQRLLQLQSTNVAAELDALLVLYREFLKTTERSKAQLVEEFSENSASAVNPTASGNAFGNMMFDLMLKLGTANERARTLFRHIVV
jgi:predicted nucleotidyltransferase